MSEANQNPRFFGRDFFRDRTVVITGASSGVGHDVALAFARQGAKVALLARRKSVLDGLAYRIEVSGGRALALECDVTQRAEVKSAIEEAISSFGPVDILVNSAGLRIPDKVEDMRPEDLERMMAVNLYGTVHAIQVVLPGMKQARNGRIINIGSLTGHHGLSPLGGYSASKFALVGLTEALRIELFRSGVRVSLVMPGLLDTPMSDRARESGVLRGVPSLFAMPVAWATLAVLAAAAFGLPEVDIPPGSAIAQKFASLFPLTTDAVLSVGANLVERLGELTKWREAAAKAAVEKVVRRKPEAGQRVAPKTAA